MAIIYITLKQCSRKDKCVNSLGSWLPSTKEYFYTDNHRKDKLTPDCKVCRLAGNAQWRQENPDYFAQYDAARQAEHNLYFREYRTTNAQVLRTKDRERYQRRAGAQVVAARARRQTLHGRNIIHTYKTRPDIRARNCVRQRNRSALKIALPNTLTDEEWQRCQMYFDGACAVCGQRVDESHVISIDHWIALTDKREGNPGTVAANIIPLCGVKKGGVFGCNQSKKNQDPVVWLSKMYNPVEAQRIIERIETYFQWIRAANP